MNFRLVTCIIVDGAHVLCTPIRSAAAEDAVAAVAHRVFTSSTNEIRAISPDCTLTESNNVIEVVFNAGLKERPGRDKLGNVYQRKVKRIIPETNGFHLSYRFGAGEYTGALARPSFPVVDKQRGGKEENFFVTAALIQLPRGTGHVQVNIYFGEHADLAAISKIHALLHTRIATPDN